MALVLELVEGATLAERIDARADADSTRRSPIARQIAHALEAAHARGIVHRDLKPAKKRLTTPGWSAKGARLRPGQGNPAGCGTEHTIPYSH